MGAILQVTEPSALYVTLPKYASTKMDLRLASGGYHQFREIRSLIAAPYRPRLNRCTQD